MKRIMMLYPPDATTHEINDMHLLYFQALKKLDGEYDITVVGRITCDEFRKTCPVDLRYIDFFSHIDRDSKPVVSDEEWKVGLPFKYMAAINQLRWQWFDRRSMEQKAIAYVGAWEELLKDADVLITTVDNLMFIYIAEGIAKRKGIPIIKPLKGRLVDDSIAFWDNDNMPIGIDAGDAIYKRFIARSESKQQIKVHTSAVLGSHDILRRLFNVPAKIAALVKNPRFDVDADIPDMVSKYNRLSDMAIYMLVRPLLNRLLVFDKPHKDEKYFLMPLHFEWEANMSLREPFLDQVGLAHEIDNCLPYGTMLYVKVHPHWKNCDQPLGKMLGLAGADNIRVIGPGFNTTDLIRNSIGVIAINSTVGYEALQEGKPLMAIGHEYFRECIEAIDVKDMNELPGGLMQMMNVKPSRTASDKFLKDYASRLVPADVESVASGFRKAMNLSFRKESSFGLRYATRCNRFDSSNLFVTKESQ